MGKTTWIRKIRSVRSGDGTLISPTRRQTVMPGPILKDGHINAATTILLTINHLQSGLEMVTKTWPLATMYPAVLR